MCLQYITVKTYVYLKKNVNAFFLQYSILNLFVNYFPVTKNISKLFTGVLKGFPNDHKKFILNDRGSNLMNIGICFI